ncbi:hypothetical protein OIDMADRAFT_27096 [Oidiodendron maius Zn]|uniref:Uncharacterized protein n=1 Tax=Oidiodendron maius (strain Zn) TaxID=913774 RepID=A0A0C3CUB0_OIDMZ|nr:hypothetical protein OIDMADRAFT_27096 [Oidiodendron maius Zn]
MDKANEVLGQGEALLDEVNLLVRHGGDIGQINLSAMARPKQELQNNYAGGVQVHRAIVMWVYRMGVPDGCTGWVWLENCRFGGCPATIAIGPPGPSASMLVGGFLKTIYKLSTMTS